VWLGAHPTRRTFPGIVEASGGNTFRETSPGVYMFNLSTKTLASGTYQVRIDLGNRASMSGQFSLK
jgi:hypothetical protein